MINYNNLWHILIEKDMNKSELKKRAGISSSTLAKLGKNEIVSLDVLEKICLVLDKDIGDIVSLKYDR